MIRESLSRNFILVLVCTFIVFLVVIVLYVQDQIKLQTEIIESDRLKIINQIASRTELRINNAVVIMEILSKNQHIVNPPSVALIDDNIHGIPEDVDVNRRNVMRDAFDYYGGFQNMLFLIPNGDVYINEPFFFQKNMTVSNFEFRDWYKEVIDTKDVVVSDVVVSKSSNKPNVVIAVPIFSQDKLFQGILTGSLSLDVIEEKLEELKSYTNERILIIDDKRTVVADSDHILKGQSVTLGIDAISNSFSNKHGIVIDTVNGTKMVVAYHPIKIGQDTWAILSMESYDDVFFTINKTIEGSLFLITIVIGIFSVSLFTVHRYFRIQFKLRKQAEDANSDLQNFISALDASSIVAMTDHNGTITYANDKFCDISKYTRDEIIGQNHRILKSGYHSPEFYAGIWKQITKGQIWKGDIKNKAKDGSYYWVKTTIVPFIGYDGKPKQYIAIRIDITNQKNQEERLQYVLNELKEADRLKEEFSTMVSHELKTPLTPIKGYCEMLMDPQVFGELNQDQKEAVKEIERNAMRLERLIGDILDVQKLDMGKMVINKEQFDITQFLAEVKNDLSSMFVDKQITLIIKSKTSDSITSDKNRLRQVIDNLVKNSVDFVAPKTGVIEIQVERKKDSMIFSVKDNGIGIPKELHHRLFKKFYQVDTSHTRKHGGTGLGLVVCKGIVEQLGGKIWFESEVEKGTIFYFSIPET